MIEKLYYKHANSDPAGSLRKIICTASDAKGQKLRSLITYNILEGAFLRLKPPGNSKRKTYGYQRTFSNTLQNISGNRKTMSPLDARAQILRESGGALYAADKRSLPRNNEQISNRSQSRIPSAKHFGATKGRTDLEAVKRVISDGFVQEVIMIGKGECIFLATRPMIDGFRMSCFISLEELKHRYGCKLR